MRQQSGKRWEKVRMSEAGKTERLPSSIGGSLVRQARLAGRKLGKGGRNGRGNICDKKGEAGKHGDAVFLRLSLIKRVWGRMGAWGKEPPFRASERGFLPPEKLLPAPQRRASSFRRRMVKWQMATARASVVSRAQPSPRTLSRRRTMKATCSFSARPVPTTDFLTSVGS